MEERIEKLERKVRQLSDNLTVQQILFHSELTVLRQTILNLATLHKIDADETSENMRKLNKLLVHQKLQDLEGSQPELATLLLAAIQQSGLLDSPPRQFVIDQTDMK